MAKAQKQETITGPWTPKPSPPGGEAGHESPQPSPPEPARTAKRSTRGMDPELIAMHEIGRILDGLNYNQVRRVLRWIDARRSEDISLFESAMSGPIDPEEPN